jgi:hypothetical protein
VTVALAFGPTSLVFLTVVSPAATETLTTGLSRAFSRVRAGPTARDPAAARRCACPEYSGRAAASPHQPRRLAASSRWVVSRPLEQRRGWPEAPFLGRLRAEHRARAEAAAAPGRPGGQPRAELRPEAVVMHRRRVRRAAPERLLPGAMQSRPPQLW